MSFLHDENVYTDVVKKALEESLRKKEAQQQPVQQPQQGMTAATVAKKLVNRLKRELSGKSEAPPNISTDMQGAKALSPSVAGTLDKLTKYLADNKIKADDYQIAYTGAEYKALPEETRNNLRLAKLTTKDDRTANQRFNDSDLWVNVPALTRYVYYLQLKAKNMLDAGAKEGKLLEVQVGRLIDEIKTRLDEDAKLQRKQKSTPENPNELPDETPVDGFSQDKIFDEKNPLKDKGNVYLYAKNLKSKGELNDWLLAGPAHFVDAQGKSHAYGDDNDPAADPCGIIRTLYARAVRKQQMAGTKDEKAAAYYVKKIKELAPSFTGADGKPCSLGGTDQTKTDPNAPTAKLSAQVINQLMSTLPFSVRDIDFNRINSFFDVVAPLMTQNPSVLSNIQDVKSKIQTVTSRYFAHGNTTVPLGQDVNQFSRMLKNIQDIYNTLGTLDSILDGTRAVVEALYSAYGNNLSDSQKAYVLGQIGRNPDDGGSIYGRNSESIEETRRSGTVTQRSGK